MTLLRDDQIQTGIISYLKSKTEITSLLVDIDGNPVPDEIREDQWQGEAFDYPNIRVRMISNRPGEVGCPSEIEVGIQVFTEEGSSKNADYIAGTIAQLLHGRSFVSNNIQFLFTSPNIIPAFRQDTRTWRSECLLRGTVVG